MHFIPLLTSWILRHFQEDFSYGITTDEWNQFLSNYSIFDYAWLYFVPGLIVYFGWV